MGLPVCRQTRNSGTKRAKKKLRDLNKGENTCELDVPGDVIWCAGRVVLFDSSWGPKFSGNYLIETVEHRIDEEGYRCQLSLRKCLKGY